MHAGSTLSLILGRIALTRRQPAPGRPLRTPLVRRPETLPPAGLGPAPRRRRPWTAVVLAALTVLAVALPGLAQEPGIVILPIDRARFLAGQRFDFRVELHGIDAPGFTVEIDGIDAEAYFGKQGQRDNADGVTSLTIRDVAFSEAGVRKVDVRAGEHHRSIFYEVVRANPGERRAKNVILFIGDGLTQSFRTAARLVGRGMSEGKYLGFLEMDMMDVYGVVTTSGMDSIATDSANSASAYATGHKSAINALGVYPDSTPDTLDDPRVENITELVKRSRHMATGIVSTAYITDATPAAMVAHTRRRSDRTIIAEQLLEAGLDVILGGGSRDFLPQSVPGSGRRDDRDLIAEFQERGYTFVSTRTELLEAGRPKKLLGLFHLDTMNTYIDREIVRDPEVIGPFTDQPTLWEMTEKAIEVLSQNPNGFFLMVEAGSIDKQAHLIDWERAVWETLELDKAVGVAKRFAARNNDTLIIVVGDHAHGLTITGTYWEGDGKTGRDAVRVYAEAGFPTYRDEDGDGFPDEIQVERTLAVGWGNHPDYRDDFKFNPRPLSPAVAVDGKAVPNPDRDPGGELQTGNLPYAVREAVHTVDDITLTASGPGAHLFGRLLDNTEVFFNMVHALGLEPPVARDGK